MNEDARLARKGRHTWRKITLRYRLETEMLRDDLRALRDWHRIELPLKPLRDFLPDSEEGWNGSRAGKALARKDKQGG